MSKVPKPAIPTSRNGRPHILKKVISNGALLPEKLCNSPGNRDKQTGGGKKAEEGARDKQKAPAI